jgi:DNA mismatch endonuclease (patch repair protein)
MLLLGFPFRHPTILPPRPDAAGRLVSTVTTSSDRPYAGDMSQSAPPASSSLTRRRMQNTPTRDTPHEMALRRELHRRGLRYRVDVRPVPSIRRRADIVFPRAQVSVFCDGCFWHGCQEHMKWPKANAAWWRDKIAITRARDADTDARVKAAGWIVIRVWEHEPAKLAADRIESIVRASVASRP